MELSRYIPLSEAVQRYNLDRAESTQAVDAGKIVAAVPDWVAEQILSASEPIGEDRATCVGLISTPLF
jgi:hypothetical protein